MFNELASVCGKQLSDVINRSLLAVDDAEAIRDKSTIITGEGLVFGSERLAFCFVLGGFASVVADILEQQNITVVKTTSALDGIGAGNVLGDLNELAKLVAEFFGDGCKGVSRVRFTLGATEMSGDDYASASAKKSFESGKGGCLLYTSPSPRD